jgi:hypothetical protein
MTHPEDELTPEQILKVDAALADAEKRLGRELTVSESLAVGGQALHCTGELVRVPLADLEGKWIVNRKGKVGQIVECWPTLHIVRVEFLAARTMRRYWWLAGASELEGLPVFDSEQEARAVRI